MAIVLIARPEALEIMLEPHERFVNYILKRYRGIRSIYILAAGRNIVATKV